MEPVHIFEIVNSYSNPYHIAFMEEDKLLEFELYAKANQLRVKSIKYLLSPSYPVTCKLLRIIHLTFLEFELEPFMFELSWNTLPNTIKARLKPKQYYLQGIN